MVFRPLSIRRPPKPRRIFSLDRCDTAVSEVNGGLKPIILRITLNKYSLRKKSKTRSTRHYFLTPKSREVGVWVSFILFHHLSPMRPTNELQRRPPRVCSQGILSTLLSPVHAYEFLSRCRCSNCTPRQPKVELFALTLSATEIRRKVHSSRDSTSQIPTW